MAKAASARGLFRATGNKPKPVAVLGLDGEWSKSSDGLEREVNDFYPTPPEPTRALLHVEQARLREFSTLWEPAAGDGAMVREMNALGFDVAASDLIDRGAGAELRSFYDFGLNDRPARAIVTNPPFSVERANAHRPPYHCSSSPQLFDRALAAGEGKRPWQESRCLMRYGSVCSGIEAASRAWEPLGWSPQFFSEIDAFPCAVLAHHYGSNLPGKPVGNGVPNHGDMTKFQEWPDHAIDLLVGGTPCQSFSVAGLRAGLADPRGNLMLTYLAVAAKYRPRWVAWENVPGVLSSGKGRDFGSFLTGLAELGYGFAYRVLDAQYVRVGGFGRAVPQRRRRVFVVGYLGDWRRAAAVLFDGASLRGDPAPSRQTGENSAGTIDASLGRRRGSGMNPNQLAGIPAVSPAMKARDSKGPSSDGADDGLPIIPVAHALRADGFDASEDGTGRGTPLVPVAPTLNSGGNATGGDRQYGMSVDTAEALLAIPFDTTQITSKENRSQPKAGDPSHPLSTQAHAPAVAFHARQDSFDTDTASPPLDTHAFTVGVQQGWAVRRLTPVECARLQGFPDDYLSQVKYRGKAPADGPMYKALGNSMAVNVMRWIGERIDMVDKLP